MNRISLKPELLSKKAFSPFGDVIESRDATHFSINAGTIERFHDLANIDIGDDAAARPLVSLAQVNSVTHLPFRVPLVERHPLGSQAFYPLFDSPMLVVVGLPSESFDVKTLKAFYTDGMQGVNYHKGTWHMPLIALNLEHRFLVVDRGGPGHNCDEITLGPDVEVVLEQYLDL